MGLSLRANNQTNASHGLLPSGSASPADDVGYRTAVETAVTMNFMHARPEELLLMPMENMGLLARPSSLHLHDLNREITNLQKIGQGAGRGRRAHPFGTTSCYL